MRPNGSAAELALAGTETGITNGQAFWRFEEIKATNSGVWEKEMRTTGNVFVDLKDRFSFKGYRSGHMMYLRAEDLVTANEDIREFILKTTPKKGQPAKY